jgi:formylglycine-generating enzyme required for sulfatase activity
MREREEWKVLGEDEMWGRLRGGMSRKPIDWAEISDILWWARARDEEAGGDAMERFLDYLRHHLQEQAAKGGGWYAGERKIWALGGVEFAMRWIPAGTFLMGTGEDDEEEPEILGDECPRHEVTITRGFWMGETPVTQEQYQAIMGENPSFFQDWGGDFPVESVSWCDVAAFTNKLSALEGFSGCFVSSEEEIRGVGDEVGDYLSCKGWRLPTEAEWEYAARAGTTTLRYGELENIAWYQENSDSATNPVGQKEANAWGLHDMLGNISEWCYDGYSDYSPQSVIDPVEAVNTRNARIFRGGNCFDEAQYVRAAFRWHDTLSACFSFIGFRLLRSGF